MGAEQIISLVTETVSTQVFGVWFLIGAAWCSLCRLVSLWWRPVSPEPKTRAILL